MKRVCSNAPRRAGFTLIEFLVVIAIMAVMTAMSLIGIQSLRQKLRSVRSQSNLAQLGSAFHAYHQTHGSLPAGSIDALTPALPGPGRQVWGWGIALLPYLDEGVRAARIDWNTGVDSTGNRELFATPPPAFQCPLGSGSEQYGYAACHHDRPADITSANRGAFILNQTVQWSDLVDGSHHTLFVGEAIAVRWAEGTHGSLRAIGKTFDLHRPSPFDLSPQEFEMERARLRMENAVAVSQIVLEEVPENSEFEMDEYDGGGAGFYEGFEEFPPPPKAESLPETGPPISFSAVRPTGTVFLLGDGSTREISRSVGITVLRRLANRFETLSANEF